MQREMSFLSTVKEDLELAPDAQIRVCKDFVEACHLSVDLSRQKHYLIGEAVGMKKPNFSKFMQGVVTAVFRHIVEFMQATGNLAPLQWLAWAMGYDIVKRREESEIERLRRENQELRKHIA